MTILKIASVLMFMTPLVPGVKAGDCRPATSSGKPCLTASSGYELNGTVCVAYTNACEKPLEFKILTTAKSHVTGTAGRGTSVRCWRVPEIGRPIDIVATPCPSDN